MNEAHSRIRLLNIEAEGLLAASRAMMEYLQADRDLSLREKQTMLDRALGYSDIAAELLKMVEITLREIAGMDALQDSAARDRRQPIH